MREQGINKAAREPILRRRQLVVTNETIHPPVPVITFGTDVRRPHEIPRDGRQKPATVPSRSLMVDLAV